LNGAALETLRDIRGLDPVPWWPPAPGWWILAAILFALFAGMAMALLRQWRLGLDWRTEAHARLVSLQRRLGTEDIRLLTGELSELMRRIAMARFGRHACAGLSGRRWLDWLGKHDPAGFDWPAQGPILLSLPYAPDRRGARPSEIEPLILAARGWLAPDEKPAPRAGRGRLRLRWPRRTAKSADGREAA